MSLPTSDNTVNVTRLGSILSTLWAKIKTALSGKQDKLTSQTAYSAKGTATKVPQITTNTLGQVTSITEVTISGVTPSSHASTATTYGIGTTSNYGHVKLATGDMNGATNTDGVAVSKNHTHSQYAPKASPALTGTPTAPTAADGTNSTQIATTAFVQSAVAQGLSVSDAMVYKGTITLGATSPGGLTVAADKGHTYKVVANGNTKEGYVDGVKVEAGDMVICNTDSTAAATSSNYSTIAAKWDFVQGNTDGVVVGPASATSGNVVVFDGATGKLVKDGGKLGTAAFKDVASSGNASTTQVVMGNDSRLTDSRTPTSHTHGNISNGGAITSTTQSSDITIATGDKLLVTDSSNSNKVVRTGAAFDTAVSDTFLCCNGNFATVKEADVRWGGSFRQELSPIEFGNMCRNVIHNPPPAAIKFEKTTDGGTTWTEQTVTDNAKMQLCNLTLGSSFSIANSEYASISSPNMLKARITLTAMENFAVTSYSNTWFYAQCKRIVVYCSRSGNSQLKIEIQSGPNFIAHNDTWTDRGTYAIAGDSGWNSIPFDMIVGGYSGQLSDRPVAIRFTYWIESGSTPRINISRIGIIPQIHWTARAGNIPFLGVPISIENNGEGTIARASRLATARKLAVSLSNTSTDTSFNGSEDVTNIKVSGQLADANIASAATWNAKQDALSTQTAYSAKGSATKVPQITTNALGQVTNIEEIDIGYINSTDLVVHNENNSTPYLLYEISGMGLTDTSKSVTTEMMIYPARSRAASVESSVANHMSFKACIHWQETMAKVNVECSIPFGTITAVVVNSATPTGGTDVSTLKIYLTPSNYVSYRVSIIDNRLRSKAALIQGTIVKKGIREAIPTASDLVIVGTTNVMTMQTKENLITSWNSTPSNTVYPSEKLVKTSINTLDGNVVHKSGDEIIGDSKTFDGSLNFRGSWDANAYQKGFGIFMLGTNSTGGNYADWTEAQKDGNHHREWSLAFPSINNINDAPFQIRITLYGGYNGRNACNVMSKRINAYLKITSPYKVIQQYGFYDQLGGSIEDEFRISEIMWDAANTRYCIKVRNVMPEKNNIVLFAVVEYLTNLNNVRNWVKGISWASTTPEIVEGGQYFSRRTGNVTDAETTANGRFINWADKPVLQGTYGDEIQYNWVGTSGTGASDAGKTATIPGFQMRAGSRAIVYFTYANTANNPTLNISSTGAKNIFANGSRITTGVNKSVLSGAVLVVFDGTQYHAIGNADTATNANITRTDDATNGDKLQIGNGTAVNIVNAKNAATAAKATGDADGTNIKQNYLKATSGTKALSFGSSTQIGTVGGSAVNVSLPSLPANPQNVIDITGETTNVVNLVVAAVMTGRYDCRYVCLTNNGANNITGTPVSGLSFYLDIFAVRYASDTDYMYELAFYPRQPNEAVNNGFRYPYIATCIQTSGSSTPVLSAWVNTTPGTAAFKNVPSSGDASSTQVVMGNDSRLLKRLENFAGFKVSKPLATNWYDGYGASLLTFFGGSGHIYHIGFRLVGKTSTDTATASNPLLPGSRIYITVDGVADAYVKELEVYYKVVDNNVEVMVLTPLTSDGTQRINLKGVITRDYELTTSNSTIITTLAPSIDGWTRKTTDIVSNRMQTLLPTSGSGSNLKYNINISGTASAADTAAEAGYATAFNIASATTGNVVDTTLYKIPVLDDNAAGRWTGKPSTSTGTQQRLLYNPSNNTINANISGDAQSVRGYYITKTLVNDSNAIIFF